MPPSTREVEIKLPFDGAKSALEALRSIGASPSAPRGFEDNRVYDSDGGDLERQGRLLRLRVTGTGATLTFKAPVEEPSRHKVREEWETAVADADSAGRILEGLGYRVRWRYQKYRTTLTLPGIVATVDETPIGCWVELEGDGAAIDRCASELGFPPERYETGTYRDLAERRFGVPPPDLVFEEDRS